MAIAQVSENSRTAIEKIQGHVAKVKADIEQNEKIAVEKLAVSKEEERTLKSAAEDGEAARL
jgi:hypothetical protein